MTAYFYKPIARVLAIVIVWAVVLGGVVYASGRTLAEQPADRAVSQIQQQLRDRDRLRDGSCEVAAVRQRDRDCDQLGKQSGTVTRTRTRKGA